MASAGTRQAWAIPALYVASVGGFLLAWTAVSAGFDIPSLFPSPADASSAVFELVRDGTLFEDTWSTFARLAAGFVVGSVLGFALGILMGSKRVIQLAADPFVHFLRFVSGFAWIEIVTIWFGLGEISKISVVVYVVLFIVTVNTFAGYRTIPVNRIRAARALGASPLELFWRVEVPSCVPAALQGMRLALAGGFLTLVGAEMVAANAGLGFLIQNSRAFLETDRMFAGIVALAVLGLIVDQLFVRASRISLGRFYSGH